MNATAFRYITDALTPEEALAMLKEKAASRAEREAKVRQLGYPAYVTSAGWLGYSDEKVARLTREAVQAGFNHFKMKVGADRDNDVRRGKIIRSIIAAMDPDDRLAFAEELGSMKELDFAEEEELLDVRAVPAELEEIVENQDFLEAQ